MKNWIRLRDSSNPFSSKKVPLTFDLATLAQYKNEALEEESLFFKYHADAIKEEFWKAHAIIGIKRLILLHQVDKGKGY